jgi:hypothetical protein
MISFVGLRAVRAAGKGNMRQPAGVARELHGPLDLLAGLGDSDLELRGQGG